MNTKLTLRMDEALIASAKSYAAAHGSSVSQMVANYFAALQGRACTGRWRTRRLAGRPGPVYPQSGRHPESQTRRATSQ